METGNWMTNTEKEEKSIMEKMWETQHQEGESREPVPVQQEEGRPESGKEYKDIETVTLKFGKGCVGNEFTGKDGIDYKEILIPNKDRNDKRPWQTFVVKANRVHEDKFGKGMWCKLPADGSTTVKRSVYKGKDENGKAVWENQKEKIPNKELKAMVEFYKEQSRDSLQDKIAGKQEQIAHRSPAERTINKTKAMEAAI